MNPFVSQSYVSEGQQKLATKKSKETRKPTVSVVMATYNGEKYIREQIDSILNQSYPIYELIIQDDCSTDSTPDICREYEAKHRNIHFYENEHNLGFNENFRTASMRATGDFVALSDQDDVWFPQKIEKQVVSIDNYDICTTGISRGTDLTNAKEEPYRSDPRPTAHFFIAPLGHTMLLRRDFIQLKSNWEGKSTFDTNLTLHADWNNGIKNIEEPLNFHRMHAKSYSSRLSKNQNGLSKLTPYLFGLKYFRRIQRLPKFSAHCQYIYDNTINSKNPSIQLQNLIAKLMLGKSVWDYLRLCLLCMTRRKDIYPLPPYKSSGLIGLIRGLFYPAIMSYSRAFVFI